VRVIESIAVRAGVLAVAALGATAQTTTRVSVSSSGTQGNDTSFFHCAISGDGRYVAFESVATNLAPGDTNPISDVFLRDVQGGTTTLVSVSSAGVQGNNPSEEPAISADGRFVAFHSYASNLVPGDTNASPDVFVRDLQTGVTTRVSVDSAGVEANDSSYDPVLSATGRYVAFRSVATNLVPGDTNARDDIFVRDLQTGTTVRGSVGAGGVQSNGWSAHPCLSADGRFLAFACDGTNLVAGDTNGSYDVFLRDLVGGATTRVSLGAAGAQANAASVEPSLSADVRFVGFTSEATNLVPGDTNQFADAFVRDLQTGVTQRVSVDSAGSEADRGGVTPCLSADGRYAAFVSQSGDLVPGDTPHLGMLLLDIFVRDLAGGVTTRVSVSGTGEQADGDSVAFAISADGRRVAFDSWGTNLVPGDTNDCRDFFVRDWQLPPVVTSCFGDGSSGPCPCGNSGLAGHGCENSSGTGGALLSAHGTHRLLEDTFAFLSSGEKPTALSIFLQGSTFLAPVTYGDGLRCVGGTLRRLYVKSAVGGVVAAPGLGDLPVSARSAALGDPIPGGGTRHYQTYYRDSSPGFCPTPPGSTFNVGNALTVVWSF